LVRATKFKLVIKQVVKEKMPSTKEYEVHEEYKRFVSSFNFSSASSISLPTSEAKR
jgi:hypothetical protein